MVDISYLKNLTTQNLEPAIRNVIQRRIDIAQGKKIDASRKLGLIAEGGAMRATISGGSFIALDFLGLNEVFDVIFGSSAGAINAAYFMSHQIAYGVAVYYQLINNKAFVDMKRVFDFRVNARIVNMDFLFDEIITKERALDVKKVRSSPTDLFFTATDATNGKCEFFSNRDVKIDLPTALKAGSAIPVAYNIQVNVGGKAYVDGSVANALPIDEAIDAGCTDILVLLTRPEGYRKKSSNGVAKMYERIRMRDYSGDFMKAYFRRDEKYNASLDTIYGLKRIERPVNISIIAPKSIVERTATDTTALKRATMDSVRNTLNKFGCSNYDVAEIIQPIIRSND